MQHLGRKIWTIAMVLVIVMGILSGCGEQAPVKSAAEQKAPSRTVTFLVDGLQWTIEDPTGKTIQQLLERADIVLKEGDQLTVTPEQQLDGDITIQVLRRCRVTVLVDGSRYTVVLLGGTVADALAAAGITPAEGQQPDHEMDKPLEDGMEITLSGAKQEEQEEEKEEENTGNTGGNTGGNTEPPAPQKTIVSVQYYDDCDGSGHGVKVITYSDGTQEEVPY